MRMRMRRQTALLGVGAGLVALLAIQIVPYGREHTNPRVTGEPAWDSAQTRSLAVRACFDCHSNETVWPSYSQIAPVSWLVQRDVDQGRRRLNFSQWGPRQRSAGESAEQVQRGRMPPSSYVMMHPVANLSGADKALLIQGLRATFGSEDGDFER
jgi:hypothetical protein